MPGGGCQIADRHLSPAGAPAICGRRGTGPGRNELFSKRGGSRTFSRRSIHGQIAHEIGQRILRGDFPPGAVLPNESAFSVELKVSRTALREAIKVLAAKGLVDSRPKIGTRVRPRNQWNMLDPDVLAWSFSVGDTERHAINLTEMRRILEPAAAALAAELPSLMPGDPEAAAALEEALAGTFAAELEKGKEA